MASEPTPTCAAVACPEGYRCELAAGHDGQHRAFLDERDEFGIIPEFVWHGSSAPVSQTTETREPAKADETDPYFVLEFCAAAIRDAITLEDGLDASTGDAVLAMIRASLGARSVGVVPTDGRRDT